MGSQISVDGLVRPHNKASREVIRVHWRCLRVGSVRASLLAAVSGKLSTAPRGLRSWAATVPAVQLP